jgi:uncharacterized protein YeaC (DUF1315 family)
MLLHARQVGNSGNRRLVCQDQAANVTQAVVLHVVQHTFAEQKKTITLASS